MCVIALVESVRPTDEQVGQMWDQNPKGGGGVAWRDTHAGRGVVRWKKGLDKNEMIAINRKLPMPYVLHFRQPSHDTSDSMLACHPFAVNDQADARLEGVIEGFVLFHNGFWGGWRDKMQSAAIASGGKIKLPGGAWSDTRALALFGHYIGWGFLEAVNEKVICLGPGETDLEMFGGPWNDIKVPNSDDVFVASNTTWERKSVVVTDRRHTAQQTQVTGNQQTAEAATRLVTGASGGSSHVTGFQPRAAAADAGRETNQQEPVQKAAEGTLQGGQTASAEALVAGGVCELCQSKVRSGTPFLGKFFCWQCWSEQQSNQRGSLWVAKCQTCHAGYAALRTIAGDKWICKVCWETNGRPQVRYGREE